MQTNNYLRMIFLTICILFFGCNAQEKNLKTFHVLQTSCYQKYKNADIDIAEKGLKELEKLVDEYEDEGIKGIDYNDVRGYLYVRLYLIFMHKEQVEKAEEFLNKGISFFSEGKIITEEEKLKGIEGYIQMIEKIDKSKGVLWSRKVEKS